MVEVHSCPWRSVHPKQEDEGMNCHGNFHAEMQQKPYQVAVGKGVSILKDRHINTYKNACLQCHSYRMLLVIDMII